jgi:hypothetical protein
MIFTTDRIWKINDQLSEGRNVSPPDEVLRAVAALIGQDTALELISLWQPSENSTTWRVVGLLDSDCIFTMKAVANESNWVSGRGTHVEERVDVQLSARIRALSDVASLVLTSTTDYEQGRAPSRHPDQANRPWDVGAAWEICWRDGSPTLALPTRTDATAGERAAAEAIVDKVRQVLAEL